jgi:hypothetical protein
VLRTGPFEELPNLASLFQFEIFLTLFFGTLPGNEFGLGVKKFRMFRMWTNHVIPYRYRYHLLNTNTNKSKIRDTGLESYMRSLHRYRY